MSPDVEPRRASRRKRVPHRGARLRERDLDILLALSKMRLLRTSDLTRLFFSAKGTSQKRLRKLYDTGLVRAVVTDLAAENRFALTRLGHALLVETLDGVEVAPFRPAPRIDGRSVAHLDLLNGFRIALALGVRQHGLDLHGFLPDWELRASDPLATLVPDALVTLGNGDASNALVFSLEVDTGTEASGIVQKKFIRYRERHALGQKVFGFSPRLVMFLTRTERRARILARQVIQAGGDSALPIVVFGTEVTVLGDGGLVTGLSLPKELAAEGDRAALFQRGLMRLRV